MRVLRSRRRGGDGMPFPARAQTKPDFSGTWTINAGKSDPAPEGGGGGGGGAGPLTIKQTATDSRVTSEGRQGPQTMTYKLDGSASSNEITGRGGVADGQVDRESGTAPAWSSRRRAT